MALNGSGTYTGTWSAFSDRRLKENIFNLSSTLEKTLSLRPVIYDWKDAALAKSQGKQIGLIAQEVEELFPELVKTDAKGLKSLDYSRLSVVLIQAFKEQQEIVVKQQSDIELLKEENQKMKDQLQEISNIKSELEKLKTLIATPSLK